MRTKPGFTLIELIVTIAIMGLMFGLLVPLVDRSLGGNRLANDAEVFRSKLEEIRLTAGSTQNADESSTSTHTGTLTYDEVGYYAIWLHQDNYNGGNGKEHYDIVRLSYPVNGTSAQIPCRPIDVQPQAWTESGPCFIERVEMSRGVDLKCLLCSQTNGNHFLAFSVPAGQFFEVETKGNVWEETTFMSDVGEDPDAPILELTYNNKTATVTIDRYTGKASVNYN